ncbi:MAG: hypothetical protein HUK28_05775 [Methanobrevibacter sp.]|nr:hypothetical protein [Methanobrevibacter sp.]
MKKIFITLLLMIFAIGCVSAHDNNATDIASNDIVVDNADYSNFTLASSANSNPSIDTYYNVQYYDVIDGNNAKIHISVNDNGCLGVQKQLDGINAIVDGKVIPVTVLKDNSGYIASFKLHDLTSGEHNIVLEFIVSHAPVIPNAEFKTDTFTIEKTINIE